MPLELELPTSVSSVTFSSSSKKICEGFCIMIGTYILHVIYLFILIFYSGIRKAKQPNEPMAHGIGQL